VVTLEGLAEGFSSQPFLYQLTYRKGHMSKRNKLLRLLSILVLSSFLLNSVSYGYAIPLQNNQNLAAYSIFQKPTKDDVRFFAIALAIADHLLVNNNDAVTIEKTMRDQFRNNQDLLKKIDFKNIYCKDGVVRVYYERQDAIYEVSICSQAAVAAQTAPQANWVNAGDRFMISTKTFQRGEPIGPNLQDAQGPSQRDLKGLLAPETNPIIENLINAGKMIELDMEDGAVKAYSIKYVDGYHPGVTKPEQYRGPPIELKDLLSSAEINNLANWMLSHKVNGNTVKFRVVVGQAAIGWEDDISHANVSHAGVRDGAIYIGGLLLRHILTDGNESLREDILDNDELRHINHLDHGTHEEYVDRLIKVVQAIRDLDAVDQAMRNDNSKELLNKLREYLGEAATNPANLFSFIAACNEIAMTQANEPIESRYPILRAVSLLDAKEQAQLVKLFEESGQRYHSFIIDSILLMLNDDVPDDWLDNMAANLKDRNIWQISSEIWLPAGGLGRVMQFHGIAMQKFLKKAGKNLNHVEPYYETMRTRNGTIEKVDYESMLGTSGQKAKLEEVAKFSVDIGSGTFPKQTTAVCYRTYKEDGTAVYLIKDAGGYYTRMLYNYNSPENPVSWEEFSEFFSKASLELVKVIDGNAKAAAEREARSWKPPVVHLNDAQLALVPAFRKKNYSDDAVLGQALVAFTTHTYPNRQIYGIGQGRHLLKKLGLEDMEEYFKHDYGLSVDITSGGIRLSDWAGCVSAAHGRDVEMFDKWKSSDHDFSHIQLIAVTNGDQRALTAGKFREIMLKLYPDADVEHPTREQITGTKKAAKHELGLMIAESRGAASGVSDIISDQPVLSYTGRLMNEKASAKRAFTEENIIKMVEMGIQVIIGAGAQRDSNIEQAYRNIEEKVRKLRAEQPQLYKGNFILLTNIDIHAQRFILTASDIQIQDSDKRTEAAGFSEADICACGGIEMAPPKHPDHPYEGILQKQGVEINMDVPGQGNTIIPENDKPASYIKAIRTFLVDKPKELKMDWQSYISHYQATSVRLSRILEARLTAAEYLRQWSRAIARKESKIRPSTGAETVIAKVEDAIDKIHSLNIDVTPPIEEGKTLWHIIPAKLVPGSPHYNQQVRFTEFVSDINRRYPNIREKIKVVTDRQDLLETVKGLAADPNNIVDVALDDESYINGLPDNVKMLVFKPVTDNLGGVGDFVQLEGVLAGLRALHIEDFGQRREKLERLYELLTGEKVTQFPNTQDAREFARNFIIKLPPIKVQDPDALRRINENLLRLMEAA